MKIKLLPALLLSMSTLVAAPAFAQSMEGECSADADCPMDYTCEEIGAYACASPPPCAEGDEECMQEEVEPCESGVIMVCVAPPPEQCDPDAADACGEGLECVTYTYEQCSGGRPDVAVSCSVTPDGEEECEESPGSGEPAEEPSCITESESYCVPQYFAPCEEDLDCGAGFRCVDEPAPCYETCSAGGGVDGADMEPSCEETCEDSSGRKYCELIEVECSSDADCAEGLGCVTFEEAYATPDCAEPLPVDEDVDGGSGSGEDPDDGGEPDDEPVDHCGDSEPVEVESKSYCVPPEWDRWVDSPTSPGEYVDYDEGVSEAAGRGSEAGGSNGEDDWTLVDKQGPSAELDGSGSGGEVEGESGGCQTTGSGAPAEGLGLLAALGMMLGLRRRKK